MSTTSARELIAPKSTTHQRGDLQGMRAIAVLTVFSNHLFDWPSGGFVGVDIFFVLSGFFITGILIRERTRTRRLSFQNFYIRRVKRIIPSALLVLFVTVVAGYLLFPANRAKETLIDGLYAAVFASNWRFQSVGADYFQRDQPPSPLQHYWSLSIEEQFYFVWPLLLVLIFAATRRAARSGSPRIRQWGLFGSMAVIVVASFGWAVYQSATDPNSAYFSTITRVWELGVGALLAIAGVWLVHLPDRIRPILTYAGLAGVAASLFLIDDTSLFPAPWAALPVLSTALVIAAFHGAEVRGVPMLTNPAARWFGDTSYTLYLWHWPVIVLLLAVLPRGPLFTVLAVTLALGLTALTYHFYEDPLRKSKTWLVEDPDVDRDRKVRFTTPLWGITGFVAAFAAIVAILGIHYTDKLAVAAREYDSRQIEDIDVQLAPPPPPPEASGKTITALTIPLPGKEPCFGAPAMLDPGCQLRTPGAALTPSVDKFANDGGSPVCWTARGEALQSCTYGYRGPDATHIALVGDSHAARVLIAIAPYLEPNKWQLTTYLGWGCAWKTPSGEECAGEMPEIQRRLIEQRYPLVLTTASREWGQPGEYVRAWKPVAANGSRIVALSDNPAVSEESLACLTRTTFGSDRTGECGTPRTEALQRPDPLLDAVEDVPAATGIDLTQYYCTADRCPSVIGDVIVYSDVGAHLTATYVRTLAPAIVDGVRRALTG